MTAREPEDAHGVEDGAEDTNLNGATQFNMKQSLKDRDYLSFSVKTTF